MEKFQDEKKNENYDSLESSRDLSLSTNSSVQYSQRQFTTKYQPLSTLNEDLNTDNVFHNRSIKHSFINLKQNYSEENTASHNRYEQPYRSGLLYEEPEKMLKSSSESSHLDILNKSHQHINIHRNEIIHPSIQPYRSLNDVTNKTQRSKLEISQKPITSPSKKLRNRSKLNIRVESLMPLSTSFVSLNDEQNHSTTNMTNSSSNQTVSYSNQSFYEQIKSKARTPLNNHYPNQERIKAHINRSVIDRQHQSYLTMSQRKDVIQKMASSNNSKLQFNNHLSRPQEQSTTRFYPISSEQAKQPLLTLSNEEIIDYFKEKRNRKKKQQLNNIDQWQQDSQKEQRQVNTKHTEKSLKTSRNSENSPNQTDNFRLNSSHHHHYHHHHEHANDRNNDQRRTITNNFFAHERGHKVQHNHSRNINFKGKANSDFNRRTQPLESVYQSKSIGLILQTKNSTMNRNIESESEYFTGNTIPLIRYRTTKVIRIPNINSQTEKNDQFYQREKLPSKSLNNLSRTIRIEARNTNDISPAIETNRFDNQSKKCSIQLHKTQKNLNKVFKTRSPTSWSILSDHQIHEQQSNPELMDHQLSKNYEMIATDDQQDFHRRYVNPADNLQHSLFHDYSSQRSSHGTYPSVNISDSNNRKDPVIQNSSNQLNTSNMIVNRESSSFFPLDYLSPTDRLSLPSEKVRISTQEDNLSANYDSDASWSDDDWSDDSAELIYVDNRYEVQK
ncbi:unnamed protein product [Rotaria magnacalcarata]|uniref:Uncharacterized protein n=1 Tax=Rotaria magnacalcarata TaxID=392030 RepID=A0A816D444_9BILA|nr:unnamed protein product [Rotaria magnacalcarata]CAF1630699.1 unnamed protein product [Rotaria magnacalcarata]CAF2093015.1 unnamed protein product [Rotaria magnacalcarata]CAF3759463.1 unnamed protein product [Rotaria magnacalcarata]CAF3816105.1 unnamed protein product [Rotaria magnacalcarata]